MPLAPGHSRGIVSNNIREMMASGHPQKQAVAAALSNARRHPGRAQGGPVGAEAVPAFHEMSLREKETSGLLPYLGPSDMALHRDDKGRFQRLAAGGIVGYQDGGGTLMGLPENIAPTSATMNPMVLNMMQRYQAMPPEKLQELAVALGPTGQGQLIQRVLQAKRMQPQIGIAPTQPMMAAGGEIPRMQAGGFSMSMADPPWERGQMRSSDIGFIHSLVPGRTDQINAQPPTGSYVIPADIVSGLGEGNSLAGAAILERALHVGPRGVPLPPGRRGAGVPIPAPPPRFTTPLMGPPAARGGRTDKGEPAPILAAGGEYVIPPGVVRMWGRGDLKRGHDLLDKFVLQKRSEIIGDMRKLKPPKKS